MEADTSESGSPVPDGGQAWKECPKSGTPFLGLKFASLVSVRRSRTAAKGFTSHWLRLISASIATSVGDSISLWADMAARSLLDAPDVTAATA